MKNYRKQTKRVRGGQVRSPFGETSEPIYMNSGYVFNTAEEARDKFAGIEEGYLYSRYGNPTVSVFEERMALNENAEACFATSSGMSAIFGSLMCFLNFGDEVVASRSLFGSCYHIFDHILPRYGIQSKLIDGTSIEEWEQHITTKTKCVFIETPSNPTMEIVDIQKVSNIAHNHGAIVIVDNIFASPILQKPMEFGADVVLYSGTKHIDGQGRSIGGAILSNKNFYDNFVKPFMRHTGPTLSPFNAWIFLKGLETLECRIEQHCYNAEKISQFLLDHPKVETTIYPFSPNHPQHELARLQMIKGGSIISFIPKSKDPFPLMNSLELFDISNNLGDAKSLITHPATTTHRIVGEEGRKLLNIPDNLIRLSIGLEDADDLIEDLEKSFLLI